MSSPKTILVSGASGLVGRPLCSALEAKGYSVRRLSRSSDDYRWNPENGAIDEAALEGVDAVIHLAGESIAQRWTPAAKERILKSRVEGAELLVREILKQGRAIDYISASGTSYYGIESNEPKDENGALGDGFLAGVTRDWEAAAGPLIEAGQRCVFVRTGVVLDEAGGALKKLLTPFKAGVGGRIGNGGQIMSWIALEDLVRVFIHCLEDGSLQGPVNAVSPQSVSNQEFTKALGKVLGRPTIFPLPSAVVKTLFGEMGSETILSNLHVKPSKLESANFSWDFPELESALEHNLR